MGESVRGPAQALQQLRLTLSGPRSSSASLTIRLDPLQPTKPRQALCVCVPSFQGALQGPLLGTRLTPAGWL